MCRKSGGLGIVDKSQFAPRATYHSLMRSGQVPVYICNKAGLQVDQTTLQDAKIFIETKTKTKASNTATLSHDNSSSPKEDTLLVP